MMKRILITWGTLGFLLMISSCFKGGKPEGGIIDGGHGVGIDSATVNGLNISEVLDSIEADSIATDEAAPMDRLHSVEYITERVSMFYQLRDDGQCCSKGYLKLLGLTEETCRLRGTEMKKVVLEMNHWTLEEDDEDPGRDWSFRILEVDNITMHHAEVVVFIKKYYETRMLLQLLLEGGDWHVDNFKMLSQAGMDANVGVMEEQEVYYNEREIMMRFLREGDE